MKHWEACLQRLPALPDCSALRLDDAAAASLPLLSFNAVLGHCLTLRLYNHPYGLPFSFRFNLNLAMPKAS
jgi:hypothetical protein